MVLILMFRMNPGYSVLSIESALRPARTKDKSHPVVSNIQGYIKSIMNPSDLKLDRLSCPQIEARYNYLNRSTVHHHPDLHHEPRKIKYFFALDLFNCSSILPNLLGAIVESMRFLGPERCALSIVEGRSTDGTREILVGLRNGVESLGAKYYLSFSDLDPRDSANDRIVVLAALRNQALEPLKAKRDPFTSDAVVIFLNDIVLCPDDLLELLHQHFVQSAEMTCAMDWLTSDKMTFYDSWIGRGMNGDLFYEIPQNADFWSFSNNLFWNNPETKKAFDSKIPFQVYSCWNGVSVMVASRFREEGLVFRSSGIDEHYMGEPMLLCKDLWRRGLGRIQVVPSVNVGYSVRDSRKIKEQWGRVGDFVDPQAETLNDTQIQWQTSPPPMVKWVSMDWLMSSWMPPL